eukprot:6294266-Prymnesium_polylepis.1
MQSFVSSTPRADEDAPPPPKGSIGQLPKGARSDSLPREKHKYVAEWDGWATKQKNAGTEPEGIMRNGNVGSYEVTLSKVRNCNWLHLPTPSITCRALPCSLTFKQHMHWLSVSALPQGLQQLTTVRRTIAPATEHTG